MTDPRDTLTPAVRAEMRANAEHTAGNGWCANIDPPTPEMWLAMDRALTAAEARAEKAERERDEARSDEALRAMEVMQFETALAAERAKNKALAEALEPFARYAVKEDCVTEFKKKYSVGTISDEFAIISINEDAFVTMGDFRHAARVLAQHQGEKAE